MKHPFIPLLLVLTPLLSASSSSFQSRSAESHNSPLVRRYKDGEVLKYHMAASNQRRNQMIRYEADARSNVRKDPSGHFVEEVQWSRVTLDGQVVPLPTSASNVRQRLSLDPAVLPSLPDFSHVNPMLIGPSADLLTFYSDLWLAIKQGTLVRPGDHAYVKHGIPNSWADGVRTLVGQDSIDFDLTLSEVDKKKGTAKLIVQHVPPAQPKINIPTKWMEVPVTQSANNWVEVDKTDGGKYLAEVGKETFNVDMTVELPGGRILSATMDNPVTVFARECTDEALTQCGQSQRYQIRREIELRSIP